MSSEEAMKKCYTALNRLTKWKSVLSGWQLGTRPLGDPECDAVRDHREATLLLRAEVSTLTRLLIDKHLVSEEEHAQALTEEADLLSAEMEKRFPGFRATDIGIEADVKKAHETTKHWKP